MKWARRAPQGLDPVGLVLSCGLHKRERALEFAPEVEAFLGREGRIIPIDV